MNQYSTPVGPDHWAPAKLVAGWCPDAVLVVVGVGQRARGLKGVVPGPVLGGLVHTVGLEQVDVVDDAVHAALEGQAVESPVGLVKGALPRKPAGGKNPVVVQREAEFADKVGDVREETGGVVSLEEVSFEEDGLGHAAGGQLEVDRVEVVTTDNVNLDRDVGVLARELLHAPLHGVATRAGRVVRGEANADGSGGRLGGLHRDDLLTGDRDFLLDDLFDLLDLGDDLDDLYDFAFATGRQERNASGSKSARAPSSKHFSTCQIPHIPSCVPKDSRHVVRATGC